MSYATVERDIEKRLITNWATTVIDINENVEFNPPADGSDWIKLRIVDETTDRVNIGNPGVHRAQGRIELEIYTGVNTGTRTGKTYAATLASLFRDAQFNGITCREASVNTIGERDGRWITLVSVPFFWDGRY